MSGLGTFTANVNEIDLGVNSNLGGTGGTANVSLAGSNTIIAQSMYVAKGPNNLGNMTVTVALGLSNTLDVGNLYVAVGKANLINEMSFNGQPGTLTIRGSSGGSTRAEVTEGLYNVSNTGQSPMGVIDLTGGTANLFIDTLTLGEGSAAIVGKPAQGTLIFNAGTVNVNTMMLGQTTPTDTSGGGSVSGVFTMGGGTLTVNNALILGSKGGSISPSGAFNLNGGVALIDSNITSAGGTGTWNFNGGTLMTGISSSTFLQGITAANVEDGGAVIDTDGNNVTINQALLQAGSGGLTKLDSGILTLTANNTYTGLTAVSGGELVLDGTDIDTSGALATSSGTLILANPEAIAAGSSLEVGNPAAVGLPLIAGAVAPLAASGTVSPVPEPSALALLCVAGIAAAAAWRRRR